MTHRKIARRAVGTGEASAAAAAIAGELRHGVIDGVEVDFRHPELPAQDWEARPFWHVWGQPPASAGIIFPGEASYRVAELRKLKSLDENVPAVFARPGDRLTIASVVPKFADRRFDHLHDAQQRLACLVIKRPSGELVCPTEPLTFYGTSQIRDGALRETFDHVLSRISAQAGVADLFERSPQDAPGCDFTPFWSLSFEDMALIAAQKAHRAYFNVRAALPSDDTADPKLSRAHLRSLVNNAALAGFLLAKAEARTAEKAGAGTMKNQVLASAARTNTVWRDKANAIWKAHPDWRTHRVAKHVAESDDDLSSVQRAIKGLAPPTSPSYKKG